MFRLQRAWQYGLNFYLQRPLKEWAPSEPGGYVIASASGMQELNRDRILYEILDDASFPAILIRVGGSQKDSQKAKASGSPDRAAELTINEALAARAPGGGKPK